MFWSVVKREIGKLSSRPIYLMGFIVVPVLLALFFVELLKPGLPLKIPSGIVDLDNSTISRQLVRNLNSSELINFTESYDSYNAAMDGVKNGDIYGFFVIPRNFERDAVNGTGPSLTFYSNLTFYVPGTLMFKGFKTMAVTTSGGIVKTDFVSKGIPSDLANLVIMPLVVNEHPLNNPWISYAYYLGPSFIIGSLGLMAVLMTVFSFTQEIKRGTSPQLYATAGYRTGTAILGKLFPQTVILFIVGLFCHSLMFHWFHYPLNGNEWNMILGLFLFIVAAQSFALIIVSALPNPRLALIVAALTGILTFSIAAFSYPIEQMYGAIAITSYILPVRYFFLIYVDQALNGLALYYSRYWFIGLLCFPLLAAIMSPLNRRWLRHPVYVP